MRTGVLSIFMSAAVLICLNFSAFAGGPWAPGHKKGYAEIALSPQFSSGMASFSLSAFAELGLGEHSFLQMKLPFNWVNSSHHTILEAIGADGQLFGPGNVEVGWRYNFLQKRWLLTGGLNLGMRTLSSDDPKGLRTGYEKWWFEPLLSVGSGFSWGYFLADLSYSIPTNDYSHEINVMAEVGKRFKKERYLSAYVDYQTDIGNGSFNASETIIYQITSLYNDGEHFLSIGLKSIIPIAGKFGFSGGLAYTIGIDENYTAIPIKVGVYAKW